MPGHGSKSRVVSVDLAKVAEALLVLAPDRRYFTNIQAVAGVQAPVDVAGVLYQLRMEGFVKRVRVGSAPYLYVVLDERGLRALIA